MDFGVEDRQAIDEGFVVTSR